MNLFATFLQRDFFYGKDKVMRRKMMDHFISVNQLTNENIYAILQLAEQYQTDEFHLAKKVFVANLFYEPSTRTKMSFVIAQEKLGMNILDFSPETSSVTKGESLYDTVKTFEAIGANMLVIRHENDDWIDELKANLSIPVINAGAGKKDHPTQCLLDIYTIYQEFGRFHNLNITIIGDIKHSRVAHSNAYALRNLGTNVSLSAADEFVDEMMPFPYISIDEATKTSDVIMLLRVQHERHGDKSNMENYNEKYGLTKAREKQMKDGAIILHPAPVNRGVEIDSDLVECSRSRIFKQMTNGVYVRMAIMTKLLTQWGIINENLIEKRNEVTTNK